MAYFIYVTDSGRYKSAPRSSFAQANETSKSTLRSPGRMDDTTDHSNLDVERPGWWNVPESGRFHVWFWIFRALCLVSLTSIDQLWDSMADEVKWETYRKKDVTRRHYVNIAVGHIGVAPAVLTTSAGFLSTQPPLKSFVPYTILVCYVLSLGSFAHALGGLLCGLAVVNIYDACDRIWARDVCLESGITDMAIHAIAGLDGHALSVVLRASLPRLAKYIAIHFYRVFDDISFNRMLYFGGVVASIIGNNRDLVLGVATTSVCMVCIRKDSAGRFRDIHKADCS
ncbi:hypothetical protein AZE42_11266 [Rhizopogon vesiculosus]|uniref:Uncharacterized protein n=1 Tax=Rhizopogon vesiculosus TaxID=180088 RepID=A0A1J8QFR3_9AGAM|nr:hypothetical protein AZE42_11266 [Rhizopogon vesiculosus]